MSRGRLRAVVAALLAAAACARDDDGAIPVVVVDGESHPYREYETFVRANAAQEPSALSDAALSALFDAFVDRLVLDRLAREDPATVDELTEDLPAVASTREEAEERARRRGAGAMLPERVAIAQLLTQRRETAIEIRDRVLAGESMEAVAAEFEGDAVYSGIQHDVTRKDLPPAFADAVLALDVGELSEVLEADYGFHLFRLVERLPAEQPDFERAVTEAAAAIDRERSSQRRERLAERARLRYNVTLLPRNLPFELDSPQPP